MTTVPILIIALIFLGLAIGGGAGFFGGRETEVITQGLVNVVPHSAWPESEGITYEELKETLLSTPDGEKGYEVLAVSYS